MAEGYAGYLAPHMATIRRLARQGMPAEKIARELYNQGVRSPWNTWPNGGSVTYALRREGLLPPEGQFLGTAWHNPKSYWLDLLPLEVARDQLRWELGQRIHRAHEAGATYAAIARPLKRSIERVRQYEAKARRQPRAPIERWIEREEAKLRFQVERSHQWERGQAETERMIATLPPLPPRRLTKAESAAAEAMATTAMGIIGLAVLAVLVSKGN